MIGKIKQAYQSWLTLYNKNFPKIERFGLGQKIDSLFLETLQLSFTASYLSPTEQKIAEMSKIITRLDGLKFFLQIAWENKLIPINKYGELSQNIEEIGRMFGGWKKGLQSKISAR